MKHALSVPNLDEKAIERFWSKVDKTSNPDGCWEWTACVNDAGYGLFAVAGRKVRAHRISYRLVKGDFDPVELVIDHVCRNHSCVNPDHLRAVTTKQNGEHRATTSDSSSGYRGVVWRRIENKWRVQVKHRGRFHWGGYHTELSDAIAAARELRLGLFSHNDLDRV